MDKSDLKKRLETSLEFFKNDLNQIRTGRVGPSLLDTVKVEAYGSILTIREVGTISILDPSTLAVSSWDKSLLETISKAILESDLGLNPVVRNDSVIIPIPPLTEDRRREFTKMVSSKMEDAKLSMRNIRQDVMKAIDASFNNKEFGEDEKFSMKDSVEEIVKEYLAQLEKFGDAKKEDIMKL